MKPKNLQYLLLLVLASSVSCDISHPKKNFRLAIPKKDFFYNHAESIIKPFLERNGYEVTLIHTKTAIDANRMVAKGEADLSLINNHSSFVAESLGVDVGNLRTVNPIASRYLFAFSRKKLSDQATEKELFKGKKIGLEVLHGEIQTNLERFFSATKTDSVQFVSVDQSPDVIVFWGTLGGLRVGKYLKEGWHPFSFTKNWIDFMTLYEPAFQSFALPAIPGDAKSKPITTLKTTTLLVINHEIGENAVYELAETFYQRKKELMIGDRMFRSIDESIDNTALLFPMHEGTSSYLRRDQPTFFERFSDTIALFLSIIAVLYGTIQSIRNAMARKRKEAIDLYFLDFLEIRSNKTITMEQKTQNLDDLFQRAVEQMTREKLDKNDFYIFSRLIQQEISMHRKTG